MIISDGRMRWFRNSIIDMWNLLWMAKGFKDDEENGFFGFLFYDFIVEVAVWISEVLEMRQAHISM